jgi:subfamily B ATP-binding cassette protein MsbA
LQSLGSEPHPLRIIKRFGSAGGGKPGAEAARRRNLWAASRELWLLAKPHRGLLAISLVLIVISRAAGLALPGSTKFLIDGVIANHRTRLLLPLIGAVVLATAVQGLTSFVLIQSLSKAAQRLIAECGPRSTLASAACRSAITTPITPAHSSLE